MRNLNRWLVARDSWIDIIQAKEEFLRNGGYESPITGISLARCRQQLEMCEERISQAVVELTKVNGPDWDL